AVRSPDLRPDRVDLLRAEHDQRDDRYPGLQRHPGHPGLALVEPAIGRTSAFRVDAQQLALLQQPDARIQRGPGRGRAAAVDRDLAHPAEEPPLEGALDALFGEVL